MSSAQTTRLPVTSSQLVTAAYLVRGQIANLEAELQQIEAQLLGLGKGKYLGTDASEAATVVAAVPPKGGAISYVLDAGDITRAKELAGGSFGKLFERTVIYRPCLSFADVAPKLLTPAKARTLIELCSRQGKATGGKSAYVTYAK